MRKTHLLYLLLPVVALGMSACVAAGSTASLGVDLPAVPTAVLMTDTPTPTATPISSPTPSPTPTQPACLVEGGTMERGEIPSDLLPLKLSFRVYLPPCYQEMLARRYPVLYLIHGQSYTDEQWDRIGADEMVDALVASGGLPPFIIVMPRDRVWTQPDEDNFGKAVVSDLIPWIDAQYRTLAERQYRAIGGLSRGASWAVHLGLSQWELFSAVGAHSLPVFWSDTYYIRDWLDDIPQEEMPRIFVDVGERDVESIVASSTWFVELLVEKGIPHEWYMFAGGHDEVYWGSHLEQYLRFYAGEW